MRESTIVAVVAFIASLGGIAAAQERVDVLVSARGQPAPFPAPSFEFKMLAIEPFEMGEPIDNAPYSAEIVNDITQPLADGNRIERRTTGAVARDSHGRVRRENQLAAIGPVVPRGSARMVTISDPVAGVFYSLDPVRRVALRSRVPKAVRGFVDGPRGSVMISGGAGPEAGLEVHLETRDEPAPPDLRVEQLGTKEYEGVRADGTRTVATIPAGAIGNVRPIEIVSERWHSPELGVVVFSSRADPRFGETIYRLTNITRAEPDASLFQVPTDYQREDLKPPFELPLQK
jgi:hypothetical protein